MERGILSAGLKSFFAWPSHTPERAWNVSAKGGAAWGSHSITGGKAYLDGEREFGEQNCGECALP